MNQYPDGDLWGQRFGAADRLYFDNLDKVLDLTDGPKDLVHHFPAFVGAVNLARYLALHQAFREVAHLAGDCADVGTWKGSSFLFIAKLLRLFEPQRCLRVHAFDWFEGTESSQETKYIGSFDSLCRLVDLQNLDDICVIHRMDLATELASFFATEVGSSLRFKYVFLDCGIAEVLEQTIPLFWQHLVPGGILVLDHFGTHVACETDAVLRQLPPTVRVQSFGFCRQPTAFIIKDYP